MRRDSSLFADDTCSWYLTAGLIHQVSAARPMKAVFCSDNLAASKAAADVCALTVLQDRVNSCKDKKTAPRPPRRNTLEVLTQRTFHVWLQDDSDSRVWLVNPPLLFSFNRRSAKFRTPSTMEERFPCHTRLSGDNPRLLPLPLPLPLNPWEGAQNSSVMFSL